MIQTSGSIAAPSQLFSLDVDERQIPGVLWIPTTPPNALVLVGHGGGGHKRSRAVVDLVASALRYGCAVLSIDGPVHGARRNDPEADPAVVRADFREGWLAGRWREGLAQDWTAALDYARSIHALKLVPVGYVGVSMGTALGLSFLVREPRVSAAVLGLWSANYPASSHLLEEAAALQVPVLFFQCWHDQIFDRAGTLDLFDAIGSRSKRLSAEPGPHEELSGDRLDDAITYLLRHISIETPTTFSSPAAPPSRHD